MSRKGNRKRRNARKERAKRRKEEQKAWVKANPGTLPRVFMAKGRRGDEAELRLTFGETPFKYDPETGDLEL